MCTVFVFGVAITLQSAPGDPYGARSKVFYANKDLVSFVRPGLVISVNSAEIAADGTISTTFTLGDPKGAPLDRLGVSTPGVVSLSFVAARIPTGQQQYVAYTTRRVSGAAVSSTDQAGADTGGTYTQLADGRYRYVFGTKVPSGFDRTATHTIGIYGNRNLTEFDLGTNYASTTFNFVPNGGPVTAVREVIKTQSCNKCHDELSAHGGSRRGLEMCVLCHTSQTVDADTGNTVDMKVMAHKIHMGAELPSVKAGKPYQIIGFGGAVVDWSTVEIPSNPSEMRSLPRAEHGSGTG